MKIIKRGVPPSERILTGTCRSCETEAEFTMDETVIRGEYMTGTWAVASCPVCGGPIVVPLTYASLR